MSRWETEDVGMIRLLMNAWKHSHTGKNNQVFFIFLSSFLDCMHTKRTQISASSASASPARQQSDHVKLFFVTFPTWHLSVGPSARANWHVATTKWVLGNMTKHTEMICIHIVAKFNTTMLVFSIHMWLFHEVNKIVVICTACWQRCISDILYY